MVDRFSGFETRGLTVPSSRLHALGAAWMVLPCGESWAMGCPHLVTSGLLQILEWLWRVPGCPTGHGHIEGPSGHSIDGGFSHWPKLVPSNFLHCPVSLGCCDSGLHPEHSSSFSQKKLGISSWYRGWLQLCQVLAHSRDTAYFPLPEPVGRVTVQTWSNVAEQRAWGRLVGAVSLQRCWDQAVCQGLIQLLLSLLEAGAGQTPGFALYTLALIQPAI